MENYYDFKLRIPPLWEKEWDEVISKAEGINKEILKLQLELSQLLKKINDFDATPERLAWIVLWTRIFSSLEATISAVNINSFYSLELINRAVFEDDLRYKIFFENMKSGVSITDLLRAFFAWGLWNDRKIIEDNIKYIDKIWDPNPVEEIAIDSNRCNIYEKLYGPLNLQSRQELQWEKNKAIKNMNNELMRITYWMNRSEIKPWLDKIENLKPKTFYSLFNKDKINVYKYLENTELDFGYSMYMKGSHFIHGSTIEQFITYCDSEIYPKFTGLSNEVDDDAKNTCSSFRTGIIFLYFAQKELWEL